MCRTKFDSISGSSLETEEGVLIQMFHSFKFKALVAVLVVVVISTTNLLVLRIGSPAEDDLDEVVSTTPSTENLVNLNQYGFNSEIELIIEEEPEPAWRANLPVTQEFKDFVVWVSAYYGFEEELIYQIMFRESSFNPKSDNGLCQGLMQVNKNYVDEYAAVGDEFCHLFSGEWDVYDPYINVVLGCRVLFDWRQMTEPMGYTELTDWLAFYNRGWKYKEDNVTTYAEWVQSCDLASIDFSYLEGKLVG